MNRYHVKFILADMPTEIYEVYDRNTNGSRRINIVDGQVDENLHLLVRRIPREMVNAAVTYRTEQKAAELKECERILAKG
jgi:hypothetical protein